MNTATHTPEPIAPIYADSRIRDLAEEAKAEGLQVYTFVKTYGGKVEQIFITDGQKIATLSTRHCICISTGTVHVPTKKVGSGFGLVCSDENTIDLDAIKKAMNTTAPQWATPTQRADVRKYATWEEYTRRSTLDYYQL